MSPAPISIRKVLAYTGSSIKDHAGDRLVIVSSNDLQEYDFCEQTMNILDWK